MCYPLSDSATTSAVSSLYLDDIEPIPTQLGLSRWTCWLGNSLENSQAAKDTVSRDTRECRTNSGVPCQGWSAPTALKSTEADSERAAGGSRPKLAIYLRPPQPTVRSSPRVRVKLGHVSNLADFRQRSQSGDEITGSADAAIYAQLFCLLSADVSRSINIAQS
jgi:hypothetical protein